MKKVMLVDDEIVIRENIRVCIDWEKEGFIYCGDAPDGEVALPLIEKWAPDILITDIKMPFMNGLELSSIVRQRLPDTKIIILSGHDEFSYARSALQIGVEEYCLKPVHSLDLIKLLHSVGDKIDHERRLKERKAYTREKLFGDLCGGLITTTEAIEAAASLSLNVISSRYAVLICDLRCSESAEYTDAASIMQAERIIDDKLSDTVSGWSFKRSRTEKVWIIHGDSASDLTATLDHIRHKLVPHLENELPCAVSFGVGSVQDRLQGIHLSFLEAEEDRNLHRLTKINQKELWNAAGRSAGTTAYLDRARFIEFLKIGTVSQLQEFVRDFAANLMEVDWKTSMYGYYLLNELMLESLQEAKKGFRSGEVSDSLVAELQGEIRKVSSWEESCRFLADLLEQLWTWRADAANKYSDIIAKVKSFIQQQYVNDRLSLQDAAEHVRVSPSHLSKVFSQETDQTFIEYLTQTRIRKAMELLQATNDKSYEIAYQVGYNDAHYFSNLFKKMTGMTTREFRRQGMPGSRSAEGEYHDSPERLA
ncbi:response regulator [Cohnella mopanensis]|uniref:response regulator n=1 Tax=Cohnella mopanensis TaxID=2911966 RepID=UPI001EF7E80E